MAIRRRTGYPPGGPALYDRITGRELLDWLGRLRGGVDGAYLDGLVDRFSVDLDRPIHHLSRGNRQKIAVIQAFMHRPGLLVLDEPTSGVDPLVQHEFRHLCREVVGGGATVFLSSHVFDEVQHLCDHVAIVRDGRLVATEAVDALRARAVRDVTIRFGGPSRASSSPRWRAFSPSTPKARCFTSSSPGLLIRSSSSRRDSTSSISSALPPTSTRSSAATTKEAIPMALLVAERGLRDRRRGLVGLALGIAAYVVLLLADPLTRTRVVVEKALGMATTVATLAVVVFVTITAMDPIVDLGVSLADLASACLGAALVGFGFGFGMVAMLVGAVSGSRAVAMGVPAALFVAAYLLVGLAGLVGWLEPFRILSPLYHAAGTHPLTNGLPPANFAILAAGCGASVVATVVIFERRDLAR